MIVKVHPNSSREMFKIIGENEYEVWLKEKRVNGKANKKLIELLSRELNVKKDKIKIKTQVGRKKVVEILNS